MHLGRNPATERIERLSKAEEKQTGMKKAVVMVVAAVAAILLVVGGIGGEESSEPSETETTVLEMAETAVSKLPVSDGEAEILSALYKTMVRNSYVETANILNEYEEKFEVMLGTSLSDGPYCYWEEEAEDGQIIRRMDQLLENGQMKGMVLTRFNTVFYGSFSDGMPEGECHAIQAMVLDEPRYTFAEGVWKQGKMDGEGKTGYHYYRKAPETGFSMTEKEGTYRENLLDGPFTYRVENGNGEKLSWKMEADRGVTVINENWVHYPFRKEYMLGSEEDAGRAYVLSEEKMQTVLWNNLILWDVKSTNK